MKQSKLKKWLDAPWTNKTYIQYCAIGTAIGAVLGAIWTVWLNQEEIHDWAEDKVETVKEKFG